jgi:hypothetical protein
MKVIIAREYGKFFTKGTMLVFDQAHLITKCVTLELPDNGNQINVSCIPEGKYTVVKYFAPSLGDCFYIQEVPGRTEIMIHKGNYAAGMQKNTKGCILVGYMYEDINNDGYLDIVNSGITMDTLQHILPDKFELHII